MTKRKEITLREHLSQAGKAKTEAKAAAARRNGLKGAANLSVEQRTERAKKAVAAREAKRKSLT